VRCQDTGHLGGRAGDADDFFIIESGAFAVRSAEAEINRLVATGSVRSVCFGALRTATVEAMEARLAQSDAVQGCRIGTDGNTGDPRDR
jgi:hypothetical protein